MKGIRFFLLVALLISMAACQNSTVTPEAGNSIDDGKSTPVEILLANSNEESSNMGVNPQGSGAEQDKPELAAKFLVDKQPAHLKQAEIFVSNPSGNDMYYDLLICKDLKGVPDDSNPIYQYKDQKVPQVQSEWITVDLLDNLITENAFWVVIVWQTKPLGSEQGKNTFTLFTDSTLDHVGQNMFKWSDQQGWVEFSKLPINLGDLLMKVTITR
jgi:hypothetical protein